MPIADSSSYRAPWWLPGGHLQTIVPALFRSAPRITTEIERLELDDGDFLDLEWLRKGSGKLAILCHGLEADAGAAYVQMTARALSDRGWDVLAWSYRGCGGEMNRLPRFYHSGATEDLAAVIGRAMDSHAAGRIDLVGFSLGGNLVMKYLGDLGDQASSRLGRAVAFSVPCDLACSAAALDTRFNREVYMKRFIKSLVDKIGAKQEAFPEMIDGRGAHAIRTFREFDEKYTAPLHGFQGAEDYWRRSSSKTVLENIRVPTLLVNALNDPFLGPACYPRDEAERSRWLTLEMPSDGGHLGFPGNRESWIADRVLRFLEQ